MKFDHNLKYPLNKLELTMTNFTIQKLKISLLNILTFLFQPNSMTFSSYKIQIYLKLKIKTQLHLLLRIIILIIQPLKKKSLTTLLYKKKTLFNNFFYR